MNSAGFRDVERKLDKAAGTYRIAVLGDSFVDATNVPENAGFVPQIERALGADCGGRHFEVLNFGVSGYGTGQEFLLLDRVLAYKPDLIVIAFYNGNDVSDTTNAANIGWQENKPLFIERDGAVEAQPFPTDDWRAWAAWLRPIVAVTDNVRLAGVAKQVLHGKPLWGKSRGAPAAEESAALAKNTLPQPQYPQMFCPPKDTTWENSWSLVERLLQAMHGRAEQGGARFLVVGVPEPVQIYPTEASRVEIVRQ